MINDKDKYNKKRAEWAKNIKLTKFQALLVKYYYIREDMGAGYIAQFFIKRYGNVCNINLSETNHYSFWGYFSDRWQFGKMLIELSMLFFGDYDWDFYYDGNKYIKNDVEEDHTNDAVGSLEIAYQSGLL